MILRRMILPNEHFHTFNTSILGDNLSRMIINPFDLFRFTSLLLFHFSYKEEISITQLHKITERAETG